MPATALAYPQEASTPSAKQGGHHDHSANLHDLAAQWLAARQEADAAWARHAEADAKVCALTPNYPHDCKAFDQANVREFAEAREAGEAAAQRGEAAAQRIAQNPRPPSYDRWRAQRDAIELACGLERLDHAARVAEEVTCGIRDQVLDAPALSLADIAAKLGILLAHVKQGDFEEAGIAAALSALDRDIRAMITPPARFASSGHHARDD